MSRGGLSRAYHVLIVEDDVDTGKSLRAVLEAHGHTASLAEDVRTGLEVLRNDGADAVLCDLTFPDGRSGLELAAEVRNDPLLRHIPLIAITGHSQSRDRRLAMDAGFDVLLAKPAAPADILAELRRLVDRERTFR